MSRGLRDGCATVPRRELLTKWREPDLTVIVVAIMVTIVHAATLAHFFQLAPALLRLLAVFAVLADGLFQVLLGLADVVAAPVITVGARGRGRSG